MATVPVINQPAVDPRTGLLTVPWYRYLTDASAGVVMNAGLVSQLPNTPLVGMSRTVTDSTVSTPGAAVTGGGTNTVGVFYDGSQWVIAAAYSPSASDDALTVAWVGV